MNKSGDSQADLTEFNPESLNSYFAAIGGDPICNTEYFNPPVRGPNFSFRKVSEKNVAIAVRNFGSDAAGINEVQPKFIKMILKYILPVLTKLINQSLDSAVIPDLWKRTLVFPLAKRRVVKEFDDLRLISLLCFFAKILSKITFVQLNQHFEENFLHNMFQSGFRENHSCQTAIMYVSEGIKRSIRAGKVVVAVLLDFKSAFPSVDHSILLKILKSYGLDARAVSWFQSYLSDRKQFLRHLNGITEGAELVKGVIQGDSNSQLLFNQPIYV